MFWFLSYLEGLKTRTHWLAFFRALLVWRVGLI